MAKKTAGEKALFLEECAFLYPLAVRGVPYVEIIDAFENQFGRRISKTTVSRRVDAERTRRMQVRPKERERIRADQAEAYASLRLRAEELLSATKVVEVHDDFGKYRARVPDLDMRARGIATYAALLRDEAKLYGTNAPERAEVTVTHVLPTDPVITRMIEEAEQHLLEASPPA